MLFNSITFLIFAISVFLLYWFVFDRNLKIQNLFIVGTSYLFYGWWDWRFLILIIFTSFWSWYSGVLIDQIRSKQNYTEEKIRILCRWVTGGNIMLNLIILIFFKYFHFFVQSFAEAFATVGVTFDLPTLKIILPVGISFYTFQALSYTIDVYRRKCDPTKDIISFFAFVSFFPQLVAGPIERSTHLLPQFYKKRFFDYNLATDGMRQMLWGFFKK